ncbi:MAG: efflux RND transporter permease subunit, partial [Planctomycetota bacterium]
MNLTQMSIRQPATVAVVVALVVVFGVIAIAELPIQLLPNLERPQIQIFNNWREAAPEEMEANIIEPQERVLRNTPGVVQMSSNISRGSGGITLTFDVETDMQRALIDVVNNLNRAPPRPTDAENPVVAAGAGFNAPTTASLLVRPLPDNPNQDLYREEYQKAIEDIIEPRLSRIPGVSQVNLQSRRTRQVKIVFDPFRAAALGLSVGNIADAVGRANDVSGGFAAVGRRQYTVRYAGRFDVDDLGKMIVGWSDERPIQLRELADVRIELDDPRGFIRRNGYPAYYITVQQTPDSNTVQILDRVNIAIAELNEGPLAKLGLTLDLSFDASVHIRRALRLVQNNLGLGVLLALGVLLFRS